MVSVWSLTSGLLVLASILPARGDPPDAPAIVEVEVSGDWSSAAEGVLWADDFETASDLARIYDAVNADSGRFAISADDGLGGSRRPGSRRRERLDQAERPERCVGCEVWRALDWMVDSDKVTMDLSDHENLRFALLGVFDSQIVGGKRYDLASMGRRRAIATYFESHGVDVTTDLSYGMDLTPLVNDANSSPTEFASNFMERFMNDVNDRIQRMS